RSFAEYLVGSPAISSRVSSDMPRYATRCRNSWRKSSVVRTIASGCCSVIDPAGGGANHFAQHDHAGASVNAPNFGPNFGPKQKKTGHNRTTRTLIPTCGNPLKS